jgi:hypothetical protein
MRCRSRVQMPAHHAARLKAGATCMCTSGLRYEAANSESRKKSPVIAKIKCHYLLATSPHTKVGLESYEKETHSRSLILSPLHDQTRSRTIRLRLFRHISFPTLFSKDQDFYDKTRVQFLSLCSTHHNMIWGKRERALGLINHD